MKWTATGRIRTCIPSPTGNTPDAWCHSATVRANREITEPLPILQFYVASSALVDLHYISIS